MGASPSALRGAWWASGEARKLDGGQRVPAFGEVVRDAALVERPGRVVDWDGEQLLTLTPPAGGQTWTARLDDVHPDRHAAPAAAANRTSAASLLEQLDGAPLGLAELGAVLRATQNVAVDEEFRGGTRGHTILTATDTVRDRQRWGRVLADLSPIDDAVRVQVARAACSVILGCAPGEPITALLRWQSGVVHDRCALGRVLGTAAERVETLASLARTESVLASMEAAPDAVDERP
jgi:hypothetical protein